MLWAIAAAFLFLPQLLFARQVNDRTPDQLFRGEHVAMDSVAVLLVLAGTLLAQIMIARLIARDGKPRYRQFLPRMWRHLNANLEQSALAPVARWFDRHVPAEVRA